MILNTIPGSRYFIIFLVVPDDMFFWSWFPGLIFIWYWTITPLGLVGAFHDTSMESSIWLTAQFISVGGPGSVMN